MGGTFALILLVFIVRKELVNAQTVVWSDEFDGTSLDLTKWEYEVGSLQVNNEQEYYSRDNVALNGAGQLVITAQSATADNNPAQGAFDYTSGRIITRDLMAVTYGRVEARIQLPLVVGTWPAFWMIGQNIKEVNWPACGEIDIMEQVNDDPTVHSSLHWSDSSGTQNDWTQTTGASAGGYHVYALEWSSSSMDFFVDGNNFASYGINSGDNSANTFGLPFFIILNLAVGGDFPGNIFGSLNAQMLVDYVRVYSTSAVPSPSISLDYAPLYTQTAPPIGQQLQILSNDNYFYVSGNDGQQPAMNADISVPGASETWTVVKVGNCNNYISLQLQSSGQFAENSDPSGASPLVADQPTNKVSPTWFTWVASGNGFFSLKCMNGMYASVWPGFDQPGNIYCNAPSLECA